MVQTKITVNKAWIILDYPMDVITCDDLFDDLADRSEYSETGGGWRLIRKKLTDLIKSHLDTQDTVEFDEPYWCYLKVESVKLGEEPNG